MGLMQIRSQFSNVIYRKTEDESLVSGALYSIYRRSGPSLFNHFYSYFVYTILTIMDLFGTMTRYGVHKISFYSCNNNTENETPNDTDENTENEAC